MLLHRKGISRLPEVWHVEGRDSAAPLDLQEVPITHSDSAASESRIERTVVAAPEGHCASEGEGMGILRSNTVKSTTTQTQQVLAFLKRYGSIDPLTAWKELRSARLAARIHDLRCKGLNIRTERVRRNGSTFARYTLQA